MTWGMGDMGRGDLRMLAFHGLVEVARARVVATYSWVGLATPAICIRDFRLRLGHSLGAQTLQRDLPTNGIPTFAHRQRPDYRLTIEI